nr:MAG TPA: hypothetical protein [Caudoviricetes sp.]
MNFEFYSLIFTALNFTVLLMFYANIIICIF